MRRVLLVLLFLVYLFTSIFYINMYEFKNIEDIFWKDKQVSSFTIFNIQKVDTPDKLIRVFNLLAKKHNINIYKVSFQNRSSINKRKIKIYTTCNNKAFEDISLSYGRVLKNSDLPNKFISSNRVNNKDQIGKMKFFNLSSELYVYNLCGVLFNGESMGQWFVNTRDMNKLRLLKTDLENELGSSSEGTEICFFPKDPNGQLVEGLSVEAIDLSINPISSGMSMEVHDLQFKIISILMTLYVICFLTMIYWMFSRYKELAVRKMLGESNIKLKVNIIFKDILKLHIIGFVVTGLIIYSFLIYKMGIENISLFFKDWLIFNIKLTLISLMLMFIPLNLIKYIKIPLMLKNKKPIKITQKINYIFKVLIGIATITSIINCSTDLFELYNKKIEDKNWEKALNYGVVEASATFSDTIEGFEGTDYEEMHNLNEKTKDWFKVCNKKGAICINACNHIYDVGTYNDDKNEISSLIKKSIRVNNNYLQLNPIYDLDGNQINIPDHEEHILNLLVPQKLKKYDVQLREKYSSTFYSNNWSDYKLNIIYIKDDQRCFTFNTEAALSSQNYVIGSIIQVISNNNMNIEDYGCCWCNGFYPRITNIDNPFQDLLPDIKSCGVEKSLVGATTLYEEAAQDIYETKQIFSQTLKLMILSITLILMLIISVCINYLEQNKIKNVIQKLHGEGFIKRNYELIKSVVIAWSISVVLMLLINYKSSIIEGIIYFLCMPYEMIFIKVPISPIGFNMEYINWKVVLGVILGDILISTVLLRIYENKKISTVLKGE